jgi:hypothetical protein
MKGSLVSAKNENRFLTDASRSDQSPQGIVAAVWCCDQPSNKNHPLWLKSSFPQRSRPLPTLRVEQFFSVPFGHR